MLPRTVQTIPGSIDAELDGGAGHPAVLDALHALRAGDFSVRLPRGTPGASAELCDAFNAVAALSEQTARELRRLSRIVGRHGQMGERAAIPGASGEWARNVDAINGLVEHLTEPAIQVSRVLGAVAAGDLTQRMAVSVNGRPLRGEFQRWAELVNTMVDQLNAFASEVTRVAREVGTEGKLGGQADVRGVGGTWKDLTDSVNSMAGNLTGQVRNIAEVTTAVAQGDLSKKITVDVRGEILELKNTVNTMVDQLNAFASEVTRVAREVGTEGKLGGQADVRGVGGTWKDLTDSVNLLAANLTTQVRAIGEVATAVTRGDLGRTVEVEAQGEVRILKDDINEMIRRLRDTTRENADQVWLKHNLARFTSMLQGERDPERVARLILSELGPLIGVLSSVFYVRETDGEGSRLRLLASYARESSPGPPKVVQLGEGLLGQCAVEGRRILVSEVPDHYAEISSALGRAAPNTIVLLPVRFEQETLAVIELAAFDTFTEAQLDFLAQLSESIAIVLNTVTANQRTAALAQEQAGRAEAEAGLARLRQVVDVMPEGILIADGSGRVYLHNAAAADIMGMVPQSVSSELGAPTVHRLDGSVCPPQEQPLARAVFRREVVRGEQLLVTNATTGRQIPILVNSAPLSDPSDSAAGGVAVFQDIGPLHDLDRQRDQFLAAVSHDLRTPVAVIKGRADLLARAVSRSQNPDFEQVASGLRTIDDSTARLVRLIDELLDLTKMRMGHPVAMQLEPTDLIGISRRIAGEYDALTPDHEIRFESELESLVGEWDTARIERVLANLLSNAVKYSATGGDIEVRVWSEANDGEEWAALAVRNQGPGIPADEIERIFDTYYRGTNVSGSITGTGVGLAGVRHIVEQHGGRIDVDSAPGGATTFTVRLPLGRPAAQSGSAP